MSHTEGVAAPALSWLDKYFGASDAWASPKAEILTTDATVTVLASYDEPSEQWTSTYRVLVLCEETPVNNDAVAVELFRSYRNASGVVSAIHPTISTGGATVSPPSADLVHNAATKKVELRVTGIAARNFKWRALRLESPS